MVCDGLSQISCSLTKQFHAVIEYTQACITKSSKLTNLNIKSLVIEYSGE